MFKGMKTTLVIIAMTVIGLISCNNTSEKVVVGTEDCGHIDSICHDSVVVDIADLTITVTCDSVSITE